MEKKSFSWFEKRRRTKALDLAQEQITKALDTVTLLRKAVQSTSKSDTKEAMHHIRKMMKVEKEVDNLRTEVFKELSQGIALFAEYREDLMHLVKRLDTLADHIKDAARCVEMLQKAQIPKELWDRTLTMVSTLEKCADTLMDSIKEIAVNSKAAIKGAQKVEKIEAKIDQQYLENKSLFLKYGEQINTGSMIIFDDLTEFIEYAADMCADTADYIVILASTE